MNYDAAMNALRSVKLRLHFMDTPGEAMWNAGTKEKPSWVPDWRHEIALIEHALHGSPIIVPNNLVEVRRRSEVMK